MKEMEIMIKELLETERLKNCVDSLNINEITIKKLINQVEKEYEGILPSINVNLVSEKLIVSADVNLFKTVLRNILDNALKYTPDSSDPVEISVFDNAENILIKVEDNGQGLQEDELSKVFEPFYRTDKSRSRKTGGYGLGLHLCRKIMEAHDGEINIYNKEQGNGLVVDISIMKRN